MSISLVLEFIKTIRPVTTSCSNPIFSSIISPKLHEKNKAFRTLTD